MTVKVIAYDLHPFHTHTSKALCPVDVSGVIIEMFHHKIRVIT